MNNLKFQEADTITHGYILMSSVGTYVYDVTLKGIHRYTASITSAFHFNRSAALFHAQDYAEARIIQITSTVVYHEPITAEDLRNLPEH